jgi:uncharacterized membrane protein
MEMLGILNMEIQKEPWRFKKEISLADIITIISAGAAVIYAYTTLDKRIALIEAARAVESVSDVAFQNRMESRINKMDEKLDRIIERQVKGK